MLPSNPPTPPGIRPIVRLGHPVLRQVARDLTFDEFSTEATQNLVRDMFATLRNIGGIGLAAPQVAEAVRIVVLDIPAQPGRHSGPQVDPTVLYNAHITYLEPENLIEMWEGCLSIPGMRGRVRRFNKISVSYFDGAGKAKHIDASGYLAGVLQHELEHLDGKLYIDSLVSTQTLYFNEEMEKFHSDEPVCRTGDIKFSEA